MPGMNGTLYSGDGANTSGRTGGGGNATIESGWIAVYSARALGADDRRSADRGEWRWGPITGIIGRSL